MNWGTLSGRLVTQVSYFTLGALIPWLICLLPLLYFIVISLWQCFQRGQKGWQKKWFLVGRVFSDYEENQSPLCLYQSLGLITRDLGTFYQLIHHNFSLSYYVPPLSWRIKRELMHKNLFSSNWFYCKKWRNWCGQSADASCVCHFRQYPLHFYSLTTM